MKVFSIGRYVLIGILSFGAQLFAQTTTPPTFSQAVTTGVISFSINQSAQLNVLNLSAAPATASAVAIPCTAELEFRDAQNNLLKSLVVPNIPPGDAASLTMDRTEAPNISVPRFAIRGVVRTGLLKPVSAGGTTTAPNACAVMPTLEVFDDTTGNTQLVTSDTRSIATPIAIPLAH